MVDLSTMDVAYRHSRVIHSHFYKPRASRRTRVLRAMTPAAILILLSVTSGCRVRQHKLNAETEVSVSAKPLNLPAERAPLPNQPAKAPSTSSPENASLQELPVAPVTAVPDVAVEDESAKGTTLVVAPSVGVGVPPAEKPPEQEQAESLVSAGGWAVVAFGGGRVLDKEDQQDLLPGSPERMDAAALAAHIVSKLEQQSATNAAQGAALRADGLTQETDALLLDTDGRFAGAFGVRRAKSPVQLAETLYRTGQQELHGTAVDQLAERLGTAGDSWRTDAGNLAYLYDLASVLRAGRPQNSIFQLYAPVDQVTAALSQANDLSDSPPKNRGLLFALVMDAEGRGAIAASYGGTPLLLPGAPTELQTPDLLFSLMEKEALLLLPGSCSVPASDLRRSFSPLGTVAPKVRERCQSGLYVLVRGAKLETNLPLEQLLVSSFFGPPPSAKEKSLSSSSIQPAPLPKTPPSAAAPRPSSETTKPAPPKPALPKPATGGSATP